MKKKRLLIIICAAVLAFATACSPVAMADESPLIPVSVEEYMRDNSRRVTKVYQLALTDSTRQIPIDDFERGGYLYQFLEMTKENVVGVDTKEYAESVTKDCPSGDSGEALKVLDAERRVTTPEGYEGTLLLDHTSVKVSVKGYKTSSKNITATRTYANLEDADLELIPKSITENGNALTLNDAQWESTSSEEGDLRFTATAEYTGTSTSRIATGYSVTANYTGHVVKTNCEMIIYTVTFAGTELPPKPTPTFTPTPTPELLEDTETENHAERDNSVSLPDARPWDGRDTLSLAGCIGGIAALTGAALYVMRQKKRGAEAI